MDEQSRLAAEAALTADRMWRRRDRVRQAAMDEVVTIIGQIYDPSTGGVGSTAVPPLDGDVTGPIGGNTVEGVRGRPYSASAPADGDVYVWDATAALWVPGSASGTVITIEDEAGAPLTPRSVVNITGPIVQATDDAPNNRTNITVTDPVPSHVAAADPHTAYQKESEKGSANGYAGLNGSGIVPQEQLGTGTQDGTRFLRDDGVWGQLTTSDPALATVLTNPMTDGGDMIVGAPGSTLANLALSTLGAIALPSSGTGEGSAIDNNDGTNWTAGAGNSTQWLRVDLGQSRVITHFRLLQNGPTNSTRANAFVIQSSPDGGSWTTQYSSGSGWTVIPDSGIIPLPAPINARYWRIFASPTGLDPWRIHTLAFYGSGQGQPQRLPGGSRPGQVLTWGSDGLPLWANAPSGGGGGGALVTGQTVEDYRNVALMAIQGTVAAASSAMDATGFYGASPATDAFDGNDSSWWVANVNAAGQWVSIDLGAVHDISAVRLFIKDHDEFSVSASRLQSSTDNSSWTDRMSLGAFHDTGVIPIPGGPITARYWRWYADAATALSYTRPSLTSFELLEADGKIRELVNEALTFLGASAIATATYPGFTPSNAIDNDDGTRWVSNDVDAVNRNIRVDLGAAKEIVGFRLYTLYGRSEAPYTSKLQSSTDDTNWTDRHLIGRFGETGQIPLNSGPITARYWRWVTLTGPTPVLYSLELLSGTFDAGTVGGPSLTIQEIDGAPAVLVSTIEVTNGKLTDMGDGVARLDLSAAGSSLTIREVDGTPSGIPTALKFPNGTITDNGDGTFTYTPTAGASLVVQEVDGTPTGTPGTLKFPNGTLTDNGDGSFTYTPAGGGGSLTVREVDTAPSVTATVVEFPNGTLTDQGGGVVRYTPASGGATQVSTGAYSARPAAGTAGSGVFIAQGGYTSRPAAGTQGNLYLPTDGNKIYEDTGSAWQGFGPIAALTKPPLVSAFTWVNQGGATAVNDQDAIYLDVPANAATSLRCLVMTAPATPYKITAIFLCSLFRVDTNSFGLIHRDTAAGKLTNLQVVTTATFSGTIGAGVNTYTLPTTYLGSPAGVPIAAWSQPYFLQMEDDGTNRIYRVSFDWGRHWVVVYTVARTTHHTPDQVGWCGDASNGTYGPKVSLVSWKVE